MGDSSIQFRSRRRTLAGKSRAGGQRAASLLPHLPTAAIIAVMAKSKKNHVRESRISGKAIVDAYGPEEQAMGGTTTWIAKSAFLSPPNARLPQSHHPCERDKHGHRCCQSLERVRDGDRHHLGSKRLTPWCSIFRAAGRRPYVFLFPGKTLVHIRQVRDRDFPK